MNTFQLSCFLEVARTLNFARAAEALNVTQPAVTHQIQTLESELNVKLFRRTTRTVELTEAGQLFIGDAERIVGISQQAVRRFHSRARYELQELTIGCESHLLLFAFADILRDFVRANPLVHPQIRAFPFRHQFPLLEDETLDLILGFDAPDLEPKGLVFHALLRQPLVALCRADTSSAPACTVTASDMAGQPLVLLAPHNAPMGLRGVQSRYIANHLPNTLYFCDSFETQLVMVRAGLGTALMPSQLVPDAPDLLSLPMADGVELSMGLYCKTPAAPLPKAFLQAARRAFGDR